MVPGGVIFPDIVRLHVFGMKNTSFHEKTLKYVEEKVYDDYDVSCLREGSIKNGCRLCKVECIPHSPTFQLQVLNQSLFNI